MPHRINTERFFRFLEGFKLYIETKSGTTLDDFSNNSFFQSEEGYKAIIQSTAISVLNFENWNTEIIGNGYISSKVIKAIAGCGNLIHYRQKLHFKNKVSENVKLAELILYNIYCGTDDKQSFDDAVKFFGGKYDLLSCLFFIKNKDKYLPVRSTKFDERFEFLGIPFSCAGKCSSDNYFEFISVIDELRKLMQYKYGFPISLLDAHSVIWQLEIANNFVAHLEEIHADNILVQEVNQSIDIQNENSVYSIKPKDKASAFISNGYKTYPRNRQTALNAIHHANYCCEINSTHESFIKRNSEHKYMEPHHLIPMAFSDDFDKSLDNEANIISLCSNCHNEIHYGKNADKLIEELYYQRKNLLLQAGIEISLEELIKMYH